MDLYPKYTKNTQNSTTKIGKMPEQTTIKEDTQMDINVLN
jgi:hypothetical protein